MTHESRANWIEKGEKLTKYFFQRFQIRSSDSFFQHFLRKNQCASSTDVLLTARAFYLYLYSNKEMNEEAANTLLHHFSQVSRKSNSHLMKEITKEEIKSVLVQLPNNKALDTDGLPYEFYKSFEHTLILTLTDLFNDILSKQSFPLS